MTKRTTADILASNAPNLIIAGLMVYGAYKIGLFGKSSGDNWLCKTLGLKCGDGLTEDERANLKASANAPLTVPGWKAKDLAPLIDKTVVANNKNYTVLRVLPAANAAWAVNKPFKDNFAMGVLDSIVADKFNKNIPWAQVTDKINGKVVGYVPLSHVKLV